MQQNHEKTIPVTSVLNLQNIVTDILTCLAVGVFSASFLIGIVLMLAD